MTTSLSQIDAEEREKVSENATPQLAAEANAIAEQRRREVIDRYSRIALTRVLDELNAIVVVDGLDEVENSAALKADIQRFGLALGRSRILATTRSGDHTTVLEGFQVLEICGLSDSQLDAVSSAYLGADSRRFLEKLNPFTKELATRPLFLMQMMMIFDRTGSTPERPNVICRSLVRLSLQDWDSHRRVHRRSRYADFDTDSKIEFLTALAHDLLVERGKRAFRPEDLETAYIDIAPRFDLPLNESRLVVEEIETHTGIVSSNGVGYEFSHLSIQEYLAADYLVRHSRTVNRGPRFWRDNGSGSERRCSLDLVVLEPDGVLGGVSFHGRFVRRDPR